MSGTVSRLVALACSLLFALGAAPAAAQDASERSAELRRAPDATSSHRARRGWLPPLRLRSLAPVSDVASADDGPLASDPRWFERHDDTKGAAHARAPWLDDLVAPPPQPCATEPGGGIDCSTTTTVALTEIP
jgi:hypothetical protein